MSSLVPAASIFAERSTGQSAAGTGRLAAEKVRRPAPSKLPITWPIPADQPLPEAPPRHLAHHFENPAQQLGAATLGMFIFLATEVMMFGGLFCLYAVFRNLYPAAFDYGAGLLDTRWGLLNTVILLLSSLTMAMAVQCARTGQR